ncbi:MAG: nitrilase-related carbon-nitrogen hydrolase [Candidatus Kariarchaeaceae archaeon]|jgi:N-carbamoylputrescine amidase
MTVKCGLIQASTVPFDENTPLEEIKEKNILKHEEMIREAGEKGVQILCLQEVFYGPYFPAEETTKWYGMTEPVPGPTTDRIAKLASSYNMVVVIPVYEEDQPGVYYNTAAVYDADGTYLGKYRKNHIPQVKVNDDHGFLEKFYFKPGNLGYPVFKTAYGTIGVYICYDRHFPEGARALALAGAEIIFNPSATIAGLSEYLWKLEQPAHAVANGYHVGAINRVGTEAPWNMGHFYGTSYFCNPRGEFLAEGSREEDELVIADLDFDMNRQVRDTWQFFRDRRPETYNSLVE